MNFTSYITVCAETQRDYDTKIIKKAKRLVNLPYLVNINVYVILADYYIKKQLFDT